MARPLSNKELAEQMGTTSRQISKSRRRGWIWVGEKKRKYKAPVPLHLVLKANLKKRKSRKFREN